MATNFKTMFENAREKAEEKGKKKGIAMSFKIFALLSKTPSLTNAQIAQTLEIDEEFVKTVRQEMQQLAVATA